MGETLTRQELADKIDDGSIIGKCVEYVYLTGPNVEYPVYMEFTGYSYPYNPGEQYVDYNLTNPNTEKYVDTQAFTFNKREFIDNLLLGENAVASITIINQEPEWTL